MFFLSCKIIHFFYILQLTATPFNDGRDEKSTPAHFLILVKTKSKESSVGGKWRFILGRCWFPSKIIVINLNLDV